LEEALNALKSSLIFTPASIVFHVFTEEHLREQLNENISKWPKEYREKFRIEFYSIQFTRGNDERWRNLFKPCCTQRLFIPVRLNII
jgi:UDP-xylose:glucoside alpha-1,3-xylosyltransferase